MDLENEAYLVDFLEERLIQEAVNYRHLLNENWQSEKYDKNYFPKFASETLLAEAKYWIYSRIQKLNNFEINKLLTLSLEQFNTHKPENRRDFFDNLYNGVYWFPNAPIDNKLNDYDKGFLTHAIRAYSRHFESYKSIAEKTLIDFKAGLIGTSGTFQTVSPTEQKPDKIKLRDFNVFIKHLEYNYPYKTSVMSFKYQMKDDLNYFKKEILDNLLSLTIDEKLSYLDRLSYEIETLKPNIFATVEDLTKWFEKYAITEEELLSHQHTNNVLYKILVSDPPSFNDTFEKDYNQDTEPIQKEFYNYYYGQSIETALDFISDQQIKLKNPFQTDLQFQKIKVNLTVPQLAYLFLALNKEGILDVKHKTDLFKTIADVFQTKGSDELSWKSIKNNFDKPEDTTAEFWDEKFVHLKSIAYKDKEIL